MEGLEVGYKTGSGNLMTITTCGQIFNRDEIPVSDELGVYCHTDVMECGGYNGGCPPYSPRFDNLKKSLPYFYVICVEFDMAWAIKYAAGTVGVAKRTGYFVLSYADRLTMCYIQRAIKYFENMGYYALGASNCPGCRPKDCSITRAGKCNKPKKRRFSLEATGVECHGLHRMMFDEPLPWWYRTPEYVPARMYRYAGIFCNGKGALDGLLQCFVDWDKSYNEIIPEHSRDCYMAEIPDGKAEQGNYLVYNLEG